jgi:hypothetical protein
VDLGSPEDVYVQAVQYKVDYEEGTWQVYQTIRATGDEDIIFLPPKGHSGGSFVNY